MVKIKKQSGRTWLNRLKTPSRLGHKNEPYYKTEEEALKKKDYTYNDLSISEKIIFDKMVKNYTDKQLLDRVKGLKSFKNIPDDYWLIFIRSANPISDRFDDKAYLYKGEKFIMRGTCTTHAGKSILTGGFKKYNKEGTAVMKADEWNYKTHKYGMHRGKMPAFRQCKKVKYYRDGDCDEIAEELGKVYDNNIYMNIHGSTYHRGKDIVRTRIGGFSAGCLVFNDNIIYETIVNICQPQKYLSFALINEF